MAPAVDLNIYVLSFFWSCLASGPPCFRAYTCTKARAYILHRKIVSAGFKKFIELCYLSAPPQFRVFDIF